MRSTAAGPASGLPSRGGRRRARRAMTLVEVMVTISIIVVVMGLAIPSLALLLDLRQRQAVDRLATTFAYLRDEATLRNVTFRMVFDVDRHAWAVQAGAPDATIFTSAEERIRWEEDLEDRLSRFTERELEEGAADELMEQTGRYSNFTDVNLDTQVALPGGSRFGWVYTPQYEEPVEPAEEPPEDPEEDQLVYAHIFPDGQMEFAVIRIVGDVDPEDGYTLVVEPLTGRIHVLNEQVEYDEVYEWLPESAPELP